MRASGVSGCFAGAGLAYYGAAAAGSEVVGEAVYHLVRAVGVGEGDSVHAYAGGGVQVQGFGVGLGPVAFELHQTVGGRRGVDDRGYVVAQFKHRALDLSHELEEGCHDAEGHGSGEQAVHSPEEGRGVSGGEGQADDRPGDYGEAECGA